MYRVRVFSPLSLFCWPVGSCVYTWGFIPRLDVIYTVSDRGTREKGVFNKSQRVTEEGGCFVLNLEAQPGTCV